MVVNLVPIVQNTQVQRFTLSASSDILLVASDESTLHRILHLDGKVVCVIYLWFVPNDSDVLRRRMSIVILINTVYPKFSKNLIR